MMPIGSLVNMLAVIVGSLFGLLLGQRFPENIRRISIKGIGLCTLLIGTQMALKVENILFVILSILLGGILGEFLNLQSKFEQLGDLLKKRLPIKNERFTEGLITTFILFCVGSLTIVGALEEGLRNDPTLLYTKSVLDGFSSIVFASVYGIGVLFSAFPLIIFQGGITLLAGKVEPYLTDMVINQLSATGGILIVGLGFNLLEIQNLKITNFLPALIIIIFLSLVF
ncbi:MAG: DUF554 domain-containing protein, partial [Bacteroidetes bacterium]|nr:DUF554 domain-containing protein [Bacteroidota bacterium]